MYEDDQSVVGEKKEETTYETMRAEADVLYKQNEYRKAQQFYTQALDKIDEARSKEEGGQGGKSMDPKEQEKLEEKMKKDERDILVSRSKCHLMLGNAPAALADAEASISEDKHFIKGLYQKAEALYYQGDFEPALVQYHRGHKLRPEFQEFRLGIQKAQEAINNCIGTPESVKLENKGDLSEFYKADEKNKKKPMYGKPGKQEEKKKQQKERPKSVGKNNKTIKELLGDLYQDREYLDSLWREEDAMDTNLPSSQKIQDLCLEGINYLDSRTEFWRQQKPMYARKRDRMLQQQQWNKGKNKKQDMKAIMKSIEEVDEDQANGEYEKSLKKSKRTARTIEAMSEEDCSNKMELLANVYSYTGNNYLEMGKYELALEYHQKDLDIAKEKDLEDCRSRALDNLGRVYARMSKFQKAAETWEEKLPLSKSALESTWLYHEIGRCYLEREMYEKAHDYGQKSMTAAEEACDGVWQLNASVLIAQSEVKMEKYEEASESFQKSLEMARHLEDEPVEKAIKKALEEVDRKLLEIHRLQQKDEDKGSEKGSRPGTGKSDKSKHSDGEKETKRRSPSPKPRTPTPKPRTPTPEPVKLRTPSPESDAKGKGRPDSAQSDKSDKSHKSHTSKSSKKSKSTSDHEGETSKE